MIHTDRHLHRRTVLGSIAGSTFLPLAGCTGPPDGQGNPGGAIRDVTVSEMQLVVTLREDASVDGLTVIRPNGSEFATRSVAPGVTRETFDLGMPYSPGEYEIHAIANDETVDETSLDIRPDVRITDLKLGRNHPNEMYEGASDQEIRTEIIVYAENIGSGPDGITQLRIKGDVPRPTPDDFEESGIYDTEGDSGGHLDVQTIPSGTSKVLYSNSLPFSSAGSGTACRPDGFKGEFTVILQSAVSPNRITKSFDIEYKGENLLNCEIAVKEGNE